MCSMRDNRSERLSWALLGIVQNHPFTQAGKMARKALEREGYNADVPVELMPPDCRDYIAVLDGCLLDGGKS